MATDTQSDLLKINGQYIKFYVTTNPNLPDILKNSGSAIVYHNTNGETIDDDEYSIWIGGKLIAGGRGFIESTYNTLKNVAASYDKEIGGIKTSITSLGKTLTNRYDQIINGVEQSQWNLSNYLLKSGEYADASNTYILTSIKSYSGSSEKTKIKLSDLPLLFNEAEYTDIEFTKLKYIIEYKFYNGNKQILETTNPSIDLPVNTYITKITIEFDAVLHDTGGISNIIWKTYLNNNSKVSTLSERVQNPIQYSNMSSSEPVHYTFTYNGFSDDPEQTDKTCKITEDGQKIITVDAQIIATPSTKLKTISDISATEPVYDIIHAIAAHTVTICEITINQAYEEGYMYIVDKDTAEISINENLKDAVKCRLGEIMNFNITDIESNVFYLLLSLPISHKPKQINFVNPVTKQEYNYTGYFMGIDESHSESTDATIKVYVTNEPYKWSNNGTFTYNESTVYVMKVVNTAEDVSVDSLHIKIYCDVEDKIPAESLLNYDNTISLNNVNISKIINNELFNVSNWIVVTNPKQTEQIYNGIDKLLYNINVMGTGIGHNGDFQPSPDEPYLGDVYIGFNNDGTIDSLTDIRSLERVQHYNKGDASGTYSITTQTQSYLWICVTGTIAGVSSGGFTIPMNDCIIIGDLSCYRSSNDILANTQMEITITT